MHPRSISVALAAVCLVGVCAAPVRSEAPKKASAGPVRTSPQPHKVIERGLSYLEKDALKWRKDRGCATCHHGTMTVWALSEAKAQGYPVGTEAFAEIMEWTKEQMVPHIPTVRDPRHGWRLPGVPAMYLGAMSQNLTV